MKCEIKMLRKHIKDLSKDVAENPRNYVGTTITAFIIATPVAIFDKLITPDTQYISIIATLICILVVYRILKRKCNRLKKIKQRYYRMPYNLAIITAEATIKVFIAMFIFIQPVLKRIHEHL